MNQSSSVPTMDALMAVLDDAATLRQPLLLPCGVTLPNRIAKGAMSEWMADPLQQATVAHQNLYRAFAAGGAGMLLTGNVQVDRLHLEQAGNVVIDGPQNASRRAALRAWSAAAKNAGSQIWMQLSHAGRQSQPLINPTPKAPSAVPLKMPLLKFGTPVPLTHTEILELVDRFANAAAVARETGFDGIELHAAHGYLFSQFLSPRSNLRQDDWGGDLAGRARFLLSVVTAIRRKVGSDFPIAVKLNSADFQRGGFSFEDSQVVAGWLDEAGVDLIEISGGSWEVPAMMNIEVFEPTFDPHVSQLKRDRESYFARFAPEMRRHIKRAKLMVTGGFLTARGMADAITTGGVDLIGLARPLCLDPNAPSALLKGEVAQLRRREDYLRVGPGILGTNSSIKAIRAINGLAGGTWCNAQMFRMAQGLSPDPNLNFTSTFLRLQIKDKRMNRALRAQLSIAGKKS
jgi:2,4-dienoyl-CoA reductase-like NADH-dependent reductase (Old Yellow Enzyme family)